MQRAKDDFKWFGEGLDGFPKFLPEDCVQYTIYVINSKLSDADVNAKLRDVQVAAGRLTAELLKDFIWQREGFNLKLGHENGRSFLRGETNHGDSVDDEWLIVYILRELSKQFRDVWIQVVDSDGQFLLIEAANSLPLWLNPDIADNRVWINERRLLLIPVEKPGGKTWRTQSEPDTLDLDAALRIIESPTAKILHPAKVEEEAFFRLQKYPQQIANSLHNALIRIPRKLAYVLHDGPAYISLAVESFYLRDPIAMRPLQAKGNSKLIFPPEDMVTVSVKFNRVGFAQLKSQQFPVPPSWTHVSMRKGDAKAKMRAEMGMKVTCGFEMFVSDPQNRNTKACREILQLVDNLRSGQVQLPTQEDIVKWGLQEDDESWLDIDFAEFEKELNKETRPANPSAGFGDPAMHHNFRKIVSRFEGLMDDDNAGADGADFLDDMDLNDDSSEISDSGGSDDDGEQAKDLNFHEEEFTEMMREMMDMPPEVMNEIIEKTKNARTDGKTKADSCTAPASNASNFTEGSKSQRIKAKRPSQQQEDDEIQQSMDQIEHELRDAGALDLGPTPHEIAQMSPQERVIELDASNVDDVHELVQQEHESPSKRGETEQ